MCLWDNNVYENNSAGSDGECHMYIDRNTLQWKNPEIISAIMKHVDGTPATINGQQIPQTDPQPQPDPQPSEPDPEPVTGSDLSAEYTINNWGTGYQIIIKVKNDSSQAVSGWTVKVNKSQVKIDSSWCVNIEESGDYYVITPMSWNATIQAGSSVEFGIQGAGSVGSSVDITVE